MVHQSLLPQNPSEALKSALQILSIRFLPRVLGVSSFTSPLWMSIHCGDWPQTAWGHQAKNIAHSPVNLQCMLLCFQGYDMSINYRCGHEISLIDALSCHSSQQGEEFYCMFPFFTQKSQMNAWWNSWMPSRQACHSKHSLKWSMDGLSLYMYYSISFAHTGL